MMDNKKMISELTDGQIDDLLIYTPPYTEQNAFNIKALTLKKMKTPKKLNLRKYRKLLIIAAVLLFITVGAGMTYYVGDTIINVVKINGMLHDYMDYEYIPDENAIGKWEVVDFVENIDNFEAGKQWWPGDVFFWLNITFFDNGKAVADFDTGVSSNSRPFKLSGEIRNDIYQWTKGYIWQFETIPSYTIKKLDGGDYMFIQWKSGDYTIREMKPCYYVFKKTSSDTGDYKEYIAGMDEKRLEDRRNDDPNITINEKNNGDIYDSMDYTFILDEDAVGEWETVDFVKNVDDFNPDIPCEGILYWKNVKFYINGEMDYNLRKSKWTKGYIWQNDTIPAYIIKNIDGENYMFIQWKSGDYTIRKMKPCYYVFKKTG